MTNALPDYAHQWHEYRKRRNICIAFLVLSLPYAVVGVAVESRNAKILLLAAWMVALILVKNYFDAWRCPRCGKHFFRRYWFTLHFLLPMLQRRCDHCGLAKFSSAPAEPDAPAPQHVSP